eukprot:scaffold64826_cov66-Phaeocystis_antarctica.AAC.2
MLHPRGLSAQVEEAVGGKLLLARLALLVPVDRDAQRAERVDLERVVGEQADRDHAEILQDERHDLVVAGLVGQPKRQVGVDRVEAVPRLHMWAARLVTWWGCVMPVGTVPRVAVRKGLWDARGGRCHALRLGRRSTLGMS